MPFAGRRATIVVMADRPPRTPAAPSVVVVGGGTAGIEGLLLARELLGSEAALRLIAPEREFRYRPMSPDSLFRPAAERSLRIADIVATAGAELTADRAAVVDEEQRTVLTRDGDTIGYDYLLLAPGARSARPLRQGFVWARGADPGFLDEIIAERASGAARNVAIVVPRGARWPLPAYELALVLAWTAARADAHVVVVTAEERPLAALGADAADAIAAELAKAGIEVRAGVEAFDEPPRDGAPAAQHGARLILVAEEGPHATDALVGKPTDPARLRLGSGAALAVDRLISLPTSVGPFLTGVATDAAGFIEVDDSLRVRGSERAWAAGSAVAAALEHSALAARQADAAVAAIARCAGRDPAGAMSAAPDLIGFLLSGQRERWLAENPPGTRQPSTRCLWWPPGRAVGQMLARQIAAWDPAVQDSLPEIPGGLAIRAPVALDGAGRPAPPAGAEDVDRDARVRDIDNRQLLAIRRRSREAETEYVALRSRLDGLAASQQRVIRELQEHGYLRDRPGV
jgi:NADPH-dependent 2,4-dienoyl-CoA reductase/sulfur reductase-like enzyme